MIIYIENPSLAVGVFVYWVVFAEDGCGNSSLLLQWFLP